MKSYNCKQQLFHYKWVSGYAWLFLEKCMVGFQNITVIQIPCYSSHSVQKFASNSQCLQTVQSLHLFLQKFTLPLRFLWNSCMENDLPPPPFEKKIKGFILMALKIIQIECYSALTVENFVIVNTYNF